MAQGPLIFSIHNSSGKYIQLCNIEKFLCIFVLLLSSKENSFVFIYSWNFWKRKKWMWIRETKHFAELAQCVILLYKCVICINVTNLFYPNWIFRGSYKTRKWRKIRMLANLKKYAKSRLRDSWIYVVNFATSILLLLRV